MENIIKKLMQKGYAKGNKDILSPEEIKRTKSLLEEIRKDLIKNKTIDEKNSHFNIAGKNKHLDEILAKIVNNEEITQILTKILGNNYLLWCPAVRFSESNDPGLSLHQDAKGETGLLYLVNDQKVGATIMMPGSHLIYGRFAKFVSWSTRKLLKFTSLFFSPITGKGGDYFIWFHKTWHARIPYPKEEKITIFFPFFPVSSKRIDLAEQNLHFLKNIDHPVLKRTMSADLYKTHITKLNEENNINKKNYNIPPCLKIEKFDKSNLFNIYLFLAYIKVLLLEVLFFPIYFIRVTKYIKNLFI